MLAKVTLQSQEEQIQEGIPHSLPRLPPATPVYSVWGGYATIPLDTTLEGNDLGKGMCAAVCGHWQHCVFVLCHRLVFHVPVSLVRFCSAVLIVGSHENPLIYKLPWTACLCFVLNSFKLRQSHVIHVDLPL